MRSKKNYLKKHSEYLFYAVGILLFLLVPQTANAQNQGALVAELTGNPVDYTGWTTVNITTDGNEVVLTNSLESQAGAVYFSQPFNLNQCLNWTVEFDFRLYDGSPHADGMAFWYLENPPINYGQGQSLGMPNDGFGLKVAFDTYDNDNGVPGHQPNPEIQVYYGEGYDETTPTPDMLKAYAPNLNSNEYQHAVISWFNGTITIKIEGVTVLTGTPTPFDGVQNITQGYFGFSASTGLYHDRQSIKNVQVFMEGFPLQNDSLTYAICDSGNDGYESFDLTDAQNGFFPGSSDGASYTFYTSESDALLNNDPIANPEDYVNVQQGGGDIIYVRIDYDVGCFSIGQIQLLLKPSPDPLTDQVAIPGKCDTDGDGFETYDLTQTLSDFLPSMSEVSGTFYENQTDAENDDNAIADPENYQVAAGDSDVVYVRLEADNGCYTIVTVTLTTYEAPQLNPVEDLNRCGNGPFDLTSTLDEILGNQSAQDNAITFYTSSADAESAQNPVANPAQYQAESDGQTIYFRIENADGCYQTGNFDIITHHYAILRSFELLQCDATQYDLTTVEDSLNIAANQQIIGYYASLQDITDDLPISDPAQYTIQTDQGTVYLALENPDQICPDVYQINMAHGNCELFIPEGFSPNGDGINDRFKISHLSEMYPNYELEIYSRYGRMIHKARAGSPDWDGTADNGDKVPTGTYYYVLKLPKDNAVKKSWVYLIR